MPVNLRTEEGRRQDLEAIEVNMPQGYIGERLFPRITTMRQAGTLYYRSIVADSAAQSNRAAGAAPSSTVLGSSNTTFACTELIKRYAVPFERVANLSGIEAADRLGALAAKRSVMRALEDLRVDAVLSGAADATVSGDLIDVVKTAKNAIKRYAGRTAFVCSESVYDLVMVQPDVVARLARYTAVQPADNEQILALRRTLLAMILEVDEVLIGDDDHWHVTTAGGSNNVSTQDRACVVKLPDPDENSQDMDPILGKTALYIPDGVQPFCIETFADENLKSNIYDAQVFKDVVTLNAGAAYILDGISAPSSGA